MALRGSKITLRQFAEEAGIKSPAFARDVIIGHKRLTLNSVEKFAKAMRLHRIMAEYFRHLFLRDEPDQTALDQTKIEKKIDDLRNKVKKINLSDVATDSLYSYHKWPTVYASLGDERGATVAEIVGRSFFPESVVEHILNELLVHKLISLDEKSKRYRANDPIVFVQSLSEQFKANYLKQLQDARKSAERKFDDKDSVFITADFSCEKSRQQELAAELRGLINHFVEKNELPLGDRIGCLNLSFYLRD